MQFFFNIVQGGGREPGALQSGSQCVKKSPNVQNEGGGGGGKGVLNNVKKNCTIGREGHPLTGRAAYIS